MIKILSDWDQLCANLALFGQGILLILVVLGDVTLPLSPIKGF